MTRSDHYSRYIAIEEWQYDNNNNNNNDKNKNKRRMYIQSDKNLLEFKMIYSRIKYFEIFHE